MNYRINRVNLISIMADKEISVNALAEMAGISRVTLSAIRTGKSCSLNTAQKIAAALEVPLDSLTGKEALFFEGK